VQIYYFFIKNAKIIITEAINQSMPNSFNQINLIFKDESTNNQSINLSINQLLNKYKNRPFDQLNLINVIRDE